MDISIIIVNYNTDMHLRECLKSIFKHFKNVEYEVLVVDNNSTDRSIEKLVQEFPEVKFYLRNINDGFGAACNYASKFAKGKYYYFVNPDIIFISNAVYDFFKFMENKKDIGICTGLLIDNQGKLQYSYNYFPSISWEFGQAISRGYSKRINKLLSHPSIIDSNGKEMDVDWIIGASMFVRSANFILLNGFDENIFLYYEDVDFAYRIRKLKKRVVILPWVKIQHYEKSSVESSGGNDIYFYNMHKGKLYYMYKHFSFLKRNLIRIMFIVGMIMRLITIPFRGKKSAHITNQILNILKIYFSNFKLNLNE